MVGLQLKAKLESIISFVIAMSLILQSSEVPTIQCVPIWTTHGLTNYHSVRYSLAFIYFWQSLEVFKNNLSRLKRNGHVTYRTSLSQTYLWTRLQTKVQKHVRLNILCFVTKLSKSQYVSFSVLLLWNVVLLISKFFICYETRNVITLFKIWKHWALLWNRFCY